MSKEGLKSSTGRQERVLLMTEHSPDPKLTPCSAVQAEPMILSVLLVRRSVGFAWRHNDSLAPEVTIDVTAQEGMSLPYHPARGWGGAQNCLLLALLESEVSTPLS